jgi:sensor domain CHASE-containing protein
VICVISDLSNNIGPVGTFVTSNLLAFAALAAINYLLIWAILKWKRDKSEEEKSRKEIYS